MRKWSAVCLLIAMLSMESWAGPWSCSVGPRIEKTWELYWENGLEGECRNSGILGGALGLGGSVTSTRLGSAFGSNALQQEQYLLQVAWNFRHASQVQPYVALNVGWFWLDVESRIFADLPHSSPLVALGSGLSVKIYGPLVWRGGLGYHLITGNGVNGPGSLYPLYLHASLLWRVL